jgi:hypothetical protein
MELISHPDEILSSKLSTSYLQVPAIVRDTHIYSIDQQ